MIPFRVHTGRVAPLDRANVDTDQIIPKQFLKRIERNGFGRHLFHDWRYGADGTPNPDFFLNEERYAGASVLVAGSNFGCGSSREHAAWALADYGFRAIVAPYFADIFSTNCARNGILLVTLPEDRVRGLLDRVKAAPGYELTIDLERCQAYDRQGFEESFAVDAYRRACLLQGADDIALTLECEQMIAAHEAARVR